MVREFKLLNESGQSFSLMDIENAVLLTDPSGLGYAYETEYERVGTSFIANARNIAQGQIGGTVNSLNYDNLRKLGNFIEKAESLRFSYKVPYTTGPREFFKDVNIVSLEKTEIQPNGVLSQAIVFDCLSLWYEENQTVYDASGEDEMRWDFTWDARYISFDTRSLIYDNQGHIPAPISVEISGEVIKPKIEVIVDNEVVASIEVPVDIGQYEKFQYSSETENLYIRKVLADGTYENLFTKAYININNNNIFRLPLGASEIRLTANEGEDEIPSAKVTIYPQYKVV